MPGSTTIQRGNEQFATMLYLSAVTYPTIAANAITSSTITIPGVLPLDVISWSMQNPPAHLALENIYVSAANTATFTWSSDATGIATGSLAMILEVTRCEIANLGATSFPAAIV
jgi:hypothetical protein